MAMIRCKECGNLISSKAKFCTSCGAKPKRPVYAKAWFWVIIVLVVIPTIGRLGRDDRKPSETGEIKTADIQKNPNDEHMLKVIQYHKDRMSKSKSESEFAGIESAMNFNLGLYKSGEDIAWYRAYYYALKGEEEYTKEFGNDMLDATKEYVLSFEGGSIITEVFEFYAKENSDAINAEIEAAIKITAVELAKAYRDNEVKANGLYKDKMLVVTGTVSSIGAGMFDSVFITLSDGQYYSLSEPQCSFSDDAEKEKVAELSKGDFVTVIGTCTGEILGKSGMSDCRILE